MIQEMGVELQGYPDPDPDWEGMTPIQWFEKNFSRFIVCPGLIAMQARPYTVNDPPGSGGLYVLLYRGFIAYVGISKSIHMRLFAHKRDGRPFDAYWCLQGIPELFIHRVEAYYIHSLAPPWNTHYPVPCKVADPYLALLPSDKGPEHTWAPRLPPPTSTSACSRRTET